MKLWTSNYGKSGGDPNAVSISRGVPNWFKGRKYRKLNPSSTSFNIQDQKMFTEAYQREVLDKLDPHEVVGELGDGAVLLCYEPATKFCHRQVVAQWLRDAGYDVDEVKSRKQKTAPVQKEARREPVGPPSGEEIQSPQDLFLLAYERLQERPQAHSENPSIVEQLRRALTRDATATRAQLRYMEIVCS